MVRRVGYQRIASTPNARQALDLFRGFKPDLVLTDLHTGSVDGLDLFAQINEEIPAREPSGGIREIGLRLRGVVGVWPERILDHLEVVGGMGESRARSGGPRHRR